MTARNEVGAWRFYVGLETADGSRFDRAEAAELVARRLAVVTGQGACTIVEARGWFEGRPEPALVIYVSGLVDAQKDELVDWLCAALRQRCVGVERAPVLELAGPGLVRTAEAA
ncbi:MAG: hypothetical protein KIT58_00850 [Planctomycetota bacterium]|nr:hypothetical protein [Planctomycetota bacterium]